MSRGKLIVVSGFSGSGKGTLMNEMMKRHDNYALSVSATTRKPRPGEVDGVSYFFVTDDEFRRMIDNNELIEYAGYVNHSSGGNSAPAAFDSGTCDAGISDFQRVVSVSAFDSEVASSSHGHFVFAVVKPQGGIGIVFTGTP